MVYRRLKILKGFIDRALKGPMVFIGSLGVRPSHLTVVSFVCGLLGVFFLFERTVLSAVLIFAYVLLDVLDGTLARATNTHTEFGDKLDFFVDRVIAAVFLVKYYFHTCSPVLPAAGLFCILLVSVTENDLKLFRGIIGRLR
jgi:CDP-diacylglycerol--glycerol-3-phosphate 3-phosphatidyltransferase